MKLYKEQSLSRFKFWSGAVANAARLSSDELDRIDNELSVEYPDGLHETTINDLFWLEFDYILSMVGLTEDALDERERV